VCAGSCRLLAVVLALLSFAIALLHSLRACLINDNYFCRSNDN